jgi:hypothetical protein
MIFSYLCALCVLCGESIQEKYETAKQEDSKRLAPGECPLLRDGLG